MANPPEDVFSLEFDDNDVSDPHHHHHHQDDDNDGMPASPDRERLPDIDSPRSHPTRTRVSPSRDLDDFLEDRASIADFLRNFQSYAIMPQSSKVVVLDNRISVRTAIQALEENESDSAPLWDSALHEFVGMVTLTDLIAILLGLSRTHGGGPGSSSSSTTSPPSSPRQSGASSSSPSSSKKIVSVPSTSQLDHVTLIQCKDMVHKRPSRFICLEPQDNLYDAVFTLSKFKVHRIPVIDREQNNSILYVLSPTRIIIFLMKVMPTKPSLFGYTLDRLSLGTLSSVVSCTIETRLVDVLFILDMKHFAGIPVVDSKGKCVDMFYKSMITRVSHEGLIKCMEKPVTEFLAMVRRSTKEKHFRCMRHDTLETILSRMMDYRLRSLVVVDDRDYVQGIVALGDILRLFIV